MFQQTGSRVFKGQENRVVPARALLAIIEVAPVLDVLIENC
jgi:hypothetical protein